MTNDELIHRYALGDNEALGTLFIERGYQGSCLAISNKYLNDVKSAEDAVSQVREDLLKKNLALRIANHVGRSESQFRAFVHRMAQNTAIDIYRKKQREGKRGLAPEPEAPPVIPYEKLEQIRDMVRKCAKRLYSQNQDQPSWPSKDLDFLEVCLQIGPRDLKAVVKKTGMDIDSARKRKFRLKRHLKNCPNVGPYLKLIF